MQEKIDWYQEVVDLEPSSKLFFPLAKMVAESDIPRAVETLQSGLDKHPEFIEARLFFVELLHKNKNTEDYGTRLKTQLGILSPMLMRYAGFWQAWGDSFLAETGELASNDKGLAVAFMGAMFENKNISVTDIFSAGLQAVMGKEFNPSTAPVASATPAQIDSELKSELPKKSNVALKNVPQVDAAAFMASQNTDNADLEGDESEEQFSLRTRSMAEVLAEQGDYSSALEIYNELVQVSENEEEKQDLESRIVTLRNMSGGHGESGARMAAKETPAPVTSQEAGEAKENKVSSPGKERVISVLATLADRLENRVQS